MQTTYSDIFSEISKQISSRKKIMLQRALLATWPFILCFVGLFIFNKVTGATGDEIMMYLYSSSNLVFAGALLILLFIYTIVISSILKIEKIIWVDSFFDKQNLSTKESFTISRKLFWPFLKLNILIFFRYYLLFIIIIPIAIAGSILLLMSFDLSEVAKVWAFIITFLIIIGATVAISYYLKIKLRYIKFVFLDSYDGVSVNFSQVVGTTEKLNQIFKTESFKKALVSQIGVDSAEAVAGMVTNTISSTLIRGGTNIGGLGGDSMKLIGGIFDLYSKEYTRQIANLSGIVSMYVLYREALKQHSGNEQIDNKYIYKLK